MSESDTPYDMAIVGGGLAGLVAGVRAAELGLRVILLEQGDGASYPCNSRFSGGILHMGFLDPYRPVQELVNIIDDLTEGEAKSELAQALANTGGRLVSWLQSKGTRFMRFNQEEAYKWCMAPPRASRGGIDWKDKGPDVVLRQLALEFVRLGGTLQLKARATGLLMQAGRCIGVEGLCDGKNKTWGANYCLISDGGFQANQLLVQRYITPRFETLFQRGGRTGNGDGLLMAQAAGAALTSLNRFYGHLMCNDARHNEQVWPYPQIDEIATAGIVVDDFGSRIVDEGRTGVSLANELAAVAKTDRMFAVFDQNIWDGPGANSRIPANPLLEHAGGTILRAESVADLAKKMGVPPESLERTLKDYNKALDEGGLANLNIARSDKVKPYAIRKLPLMAIPICPAITYTMGGIDIDGNAQVLDVGGNPIPGLFAAGSTTGGIEGGKNSAYIGGLIKAGSFGLLAAERAATLEGKTVNIEPIREVSASNEKLNETAPKILKNASVAHGLARFPVLHALVRHGKKAAFLIVATETLLLAALGWEFFGWIGLLLAFMIAILTLVIIIGCVELVTLVTELLLPE